MIKITDEQMEIIEKEFKAYEESQYAGKSKEERQKLGQFFTPPKISSIMIGKLNVDGTFKDTDTVMDPTCGNGSLLAISILCGAKPENVFGIELDEKILKQCHERLCSPEDFKKRYGEDIVGNKYLNGRYVPIDNIHQGNALNDECFIFPYSPFEKEHRGCEYKFEPDDDKGKVTFTDKNSGKVKFHFGAR